jgi:hypothetical protein
MGLESAGTDATFALGFYRVSRESPMALAGEKSEPVEAQRCCWPFALNIVC